MMTKPKYALALLTTFVQFVAYSTSQAAELGVKLDDDGATITIDGELFTRYMIDGGNKPVLYPVIGPTGQPVTRRYPLEPLGKGEKNDHPHHRSVWFGYEGVNGLNLWHEPRSLDKLGPHDGKQLHRKFSTIEIDGDTVLLIAENDYVDRDGTVRAKDTRTLRFGTTGDSRWIDYAIKLWSPQGPLKLGDTKEGAFAVRVAGTMKVTAKQGGKIVNSNGQVDGKAWGQPAAWVDYSGPVDGQTVGIALLAHPTSLQAEPRWHVREYGLFAANPIGARHFTGGKQTGGIERPEGEPILLRHRMLIHKGDAQQAAIAQAYQRYAKTD